MDAYAQVIEGVRLFLDYNREKGCPVDVTLRFRNAQRPSEITRSADFQRVIKPHLNAKVRYNFKVSFDNWGGAITERDLVGQMRMKSPGSDIRVPCQGLFAYIVLPDGSLRLCGCRALGTLYDEMVIGQTRDHSLASLAASARAREVVRGFYEGVRPDVCKDCSVYIPVNRAWLKRRRCEAAAACAGASCAGCASAGNQGGDDPKVE